ncbi:chemoreceptor glutamine deamidase CheD [Marinomonas ostreistagni]|uniref:chemoreceptor glutamine deamidase CheD n=1 Tax=Marinomonas ostreistagni TaxID=359209 RepID=UPI00194FA434|nr:chemoreceptor glutamine deamidase CheD [Marinomonas ostreistagni]MBM6551743.1 chemoreceptor glutamine deamidase CheD [Marinomonas ostreistagni]
MTQSSAATQTPATRTFLDHQFQKVAHKVLPGEFYATDQEVMITTLLGSCVTVCLFDLDAKVGGMNHFLLPDGVPENDLLSSAGRYGVHAMELLINDIVKLGGRRANLRAKVFGGANVLQAMTHSQVGDENVRFVQSFLKRELIPVDAYDVLGRFPRKVNFFPTSGRVMMKKLTSYYDDELITEEMRYREKVRQRRDRSGDIDIF